VGFALYVQDIVLDLECDTDGTAKCVQRFAPGFGQVVTQQAGRHYGCMDQGAGFQSVHALQFLCAEFTAFGSKIHCLAARHSRRSAGAGDEAYEFVFRNRPNTANVRQYRKREGLQGVGRQDCSRFVILDVHCRFPAAKVIIIHARQVVVYERERVNEFDGNSRGIEPGAVGPQALARGVDEQRPDPLAAVEHGIAHGFVQPGRVCGRRRQRFVEALVHAFGVGVDSIFELLWQRIQTCRSGHVAYKKICRGARARLGYNSRPSQDENSKVQLMRAVAQPNIALIKYWGKRDPARNLPAVGSISITLRDLYTEMQVEYDDSLTRDTLTINGTTDDDMLPRLSRCLDRVVGDDRPHARIESQCNFPIAAGLASSASAFAAVTVAGAAAAHTGHDVSELASLAGRASGSAARSLLGGFVELRNRAQGIEVSTLCTADSWPLSVVVAITETGPKTVGSTEAMEISRKSSPFYSSWVEQQELDLATARSAIADHDFAKLAAIAEHNCLKMHSIMWASRPPMVYWNAATMRCLQTIRRLQGEGLGVFFTIDAGPQVKAVCLPEHAESVRAALSATDGVVQIMTSGLGEGARLMSKGR